MPRRSRVHLDGVPLHIVQRGYNRGACFFDEQDDHVCLQWLGEAVQRERCSLHAYVLMTNHVHLLMTSERASAISLFIMANRSDDWAASRVMQAGPLAQNGCGLVGAKFRAARAAAVS